MFDYLKKLLSNDDISESLNIQNESVQEDHQKQLQVATAVIFIEMAKADGEFSEEERKHIVHSLTKRYNLSEEYVNDLIELSKTELKESVSLYEFSNVINEHFSIDDKRELLKNLWRLIYTDEKLDKYEDHLIKIIGGMLRMEHKQIINAKMFIRKELNLD
jgi:uncharacterized tellurite resistance protein B-like protein